MARTKLHGTDNDLHRAIQKGDLEAVRAWVAAGKEGFARREHFPHAANP